MKCPKCGYLGFEDVDRCRNCGYDFSLSTTDAPPELPLRGERNASESIADLSLVDTAGSARNVSAGSRPMVTELPLFGTIAHDDDVPLITRPSPPRPPLAVRRSTPEVPRIRHDAPRPASLDLSLDEEGAFSGGTRPPDVTASDAGVAARFVAVVIDVLILASIDALVVYFTLRICELSFGELPILPKGPLLAFLLVQNVGYLVAFTASGQTLGKMAAGIRVVSADADSSVDLGRAFLRTAMWMLLVVPAGLGFLTAVLSRDHRGLHDRFAGTRVVR
jgi:uncharacterized RDD family membrane protein YckC